METETLLGILIILALIIIFELLVMILQIGKLLRREPVTMPKMEEKRENAAAPRGKGSIGTSGTLKNKEETEPKVEGLRICPRCYSAIPADSTECPACKNPLR